MSISRGLAIDRPPQIERLNDSLGRQFEVSADQIPAATKDAKDDAELREELERRIAPITGSVAIDRWQAVKDASGKVTTYKVWARR